MWKSIIKTELGLSRLSAIIFRGTNGNNRFTRRYSTEKEGIRGEIRRSFMQESIEANNGNSFSAISWNKIKNLYPNRKTIVLTSTSTFDNSSEGKKSTRLSRNEERERQGGFELYDLDTWKEATNRFVQDVVGRGLVRWDKDWDGDLFGRDTKEALLELVHEDERV